jgi:hypothetical protein
MDTQEAIRELNDRCRQTFVDCRVVMTKAVADLNEGQRAQLLGAVRSFSEFTEDNDPHGEHDFGLIELFEGTWYWKFDYYDLTMHRGSEDPADPNKTVRVLTILNASEY